MASSLRVGKMIRFHRKKAKLSQLALAKLAGVGKTAVFDLEQGKETVRLPTLMKVLETLNISVRFTSPLMGAFERDYEAS
jgi:y4mF family transcriptional regulator